MKRVVAVLLVIVLQASASGQQSPGEANPDSKIREQTECYFDAIGRGDVKLLDDLLVEECLVFYLPVHSTQRTKLTGCLTLYFFTRTEDKRAVIEPGKKPKGLEGRKPTKRIWKGLTSSRPPQNPIRVARKYEEFLRAGDRCYADAARNLTCHG